MRWAKAAVVASVLLLPGVAVPQPAAAGPVAGALTEPETAVTPQDFAALPGIRVPVPQPIEVNVAVTDAGGAVLGAFSTQDAPQFGFDVSVQKARTAAFFSGASAGTDLRAAGPAAAAYADRDGVLVGAIGVSGDGIDQDDMVGAAGAAGFAAPAAMRSDQLVVRGVRLPY